MPCIWFPFEKTSTGLQSALQLQDFLLQNSLIPEWLQGKAQTLHHTSCINDKFTSVSKQHSQAHLDTGTVLAAVIPTLQQMDGEETASVQYKRCGTKCSCVFLSSAKANVGVQHCQHTFHMSLPIFKPYP